MLIIFIILIILPINTSAASEPELIIDSDFRFLYGVGGGKAVITVQGDLAQAVRSDIINEYFPNTSEEDLLKVNITDTFSKEYEESFEDLLELTISEDRLIIDKNPEEAGVEYSGVYKLIKIDRVDIKSLKGLTGTGINDPSKFTIELDFKGPPVENSEIKLSDGYIILYALRGEDILKEHVNVKETTKFLTVDTSSYSEPKMENGGEITHYRLILGNYLEYENEYELSGYDLVTEKTDTIRTDSFNAVHNPLLLFLIIIAFSIIPSMIAKSITQKKMVKKVIHLKILALVFFILLLIIYFIGIDSTILWISIFLIFALNIVLIYGVYIRGWGNLAKVVLHREDFLKEPPKIEKGPWHERGISNAKVGNFAEAVNCFEMALEAEPENATIWNDLGFVMRKLGNYRQAIDCFTKALEIRPNYPTAKDNLEKAKEELNSKQKKI
jgi:hypothetical protein